MFEEGQPEEPPADAPGEEHPPSRNILNEPAREQRAKEEVKKPWNIEVDEAGRMLSLRRGSPEEDVKEEEQKKKFKAYPPDVAKSR